MWKSEEDSCFSRSSHLSFYWLLHIGSNGFCFACAHSGCVLWSFQPHNQTGPFTLTGLPLTCNVSFLTADWESCTNKNSYKRCRVRNASALFCCSVLYGWHLGEVNGCKVFTKRTWQSHSRCLGFLSVPSIHVWNLIVVRGIIQPDVLRLKGGWVSRCGAAVGCKHVLVIVEVQAFR